MIDLAFLLHSWVRWLIVLVAVLAVAKFAYGWMNKATLDKMDRGLMSGFSGLIDLQALLGILLILGMGWNQAYRIEHAITMIVAAVLAHVPMRWRKDTSATALRNNLFVVVGVVIVMIVGIGVLPGLRWMFRF